MTSCTLLAESLRSFLDKSGKRKWLRFLPLPDLFRKIEGDSVRRVDQLVISNNNNNNNNKKHIKEICMLKICKIKRSLITKLKDIQWIYIQQYKNTTKRKKCYLAVHPCCFWSNFKKYLKTLVLKLETEPSSFARSFKSWAAANLNDDCPIAEDIVSPKSNRVASLKDL